MTERATTSVDLLGAGLTVSAPGDSWLAAVRGSFAEFTVPEAPEGAFTVEMETADDPRVPAGLPHTWSGQLIEGGDGRIYETETLWVVEVVGQGYALLDRSARRGHVVMKPGSESAFSFTPLMAVLDAVLAADDQHLLHAACLAVPNGSEAVLICGPSGHGKTTTTLALAHDGFGLMGDDSSVLRLNDGGACAWALPRALKVHRKTARMLPWLSHLPDNWNEEGEQSVPIAKLGELVDVAPIAPLPVAAVIVIGARRDGAHRVTRMAKPDALVRIAHDNVSNSATGVKPWNQVQFAVYAELLRHVPVFELNAGEDLGALASAIADALAGGAVRREAS